jgi:hypothetical protein
MKFRKLRIAWSVGWGLLAVLLIVFWVRSYENQTVSYNGPVFGSIIIGFDSRPGALTIGVEDIADAQPWSVHRIEKSEFTEQMLGFISTFSYSSDGVRMPYCFATSFATALAALPWLLWWPKRFSLRTLLVATTLISVVLGLIAWAAR